MKTTSASRQGKRPYMVAMVLGTALSALGSAPASAAPAPGTTAAAEAAVSDLTRYCTACWRNARLPADRWNDCTQEVFRRLLDRVPQNHWSRLLGQEDEDRRELVRAIDAVKKRTQRDARRHTALAGMVADNRDHGYSDRTHEREAVHSAAENLLSLRQQRILQMSFEGWSVHDIAGELALPAERVSDEKYKAIHKLRDHFCGNSRG